MRPRLLAALALLAFAPLAQACINAFGTDQQGRQFQADWYVGEALVAHLQPTPPHPDWVERTIAGVRREPGFVNLNDLGAILIRQGRYLRAVQHFLWLEKRYPGRAETAANLGTALELIGQDRVALRWIRIGLRRNPDEHAGTEWLHARILESKLAAAKDPDYFKTHSIAGIAFGAQRVPALPTQRPPGNDGRPVSLWQLDSALSYQLHERTQFVRPPDPVVANLLLDWATLNLAGGPIENADALYDLAVKYGAPRDVLMQQRQAHIREVLRRSAGKPPAETRQTCAICRPPGA